MPFGMSIRTRCGSPVAGLMIGAPARLQHAGIDGGRCASRIDRRKSIREERRVHRARHGVKDPPVGLRLLRLAAVQDRRQRLALRCVGALVDDACIVPPLRRPRPARRRAAAKRRPRAARRRNGPARSRHLEAAAVALVRAALELAGAAVIAVAVAERHGVDAPVDHRLFTRKKCAKADMARAGQPARSSSVHSNTKVAIIALYSASTRQFRCEVVLVDFLQITTKTRVAISAVPPLAQPARPEISCRNRRNREQVGAPGLSGGGGWGRSFWLRQRRG